MKITFLFIILSILTFSSCLQKDDSIMIDLSGEWLLIEDSYNGTNYYNNQKKIKLPGSWVSISNKNRDLVSLVTITKKVVIPQEYRGKLLTLSLGNIAISDETYFNGVNIGATGRIPDYKNRLNYDFTWLNKREYCIPKNLIKYGEENEIKIKIFSHILSGITGKIAIKDTVKTNRNIFQRNNLISLDIKSIIINIVLGIFFIIILVAYKKINSIFYTIIILIATTIIYLNLMGFHYENGLFRFKLILALFSIAYYCFTLAVEEFFERTIRYSHPVLFSILIVVLILIIFSPDSHSYVYIAGLASSLLNIAMISYFTVIVSISVVNNFKRYWMFVILSIPLIITTIQTYSSFFSMEFNKITLAFLFHLPLVLITILLTVLMDFINIYSERNIFENIIILKDRIVSQTTIKLVKNPQKVPGEKIQEIITYLDKNYIDKYNRKELAKTFDLNEDYMGQIFKKKTGITISNYINQKRISVSKDLLINNDSKIIDIAYHIGFESLVHFHREFKKSTGITPQKYRLKNRNKEI